MTNGADPNPADGNPFSLLAYVLFKVRHAMEDREEADRPPRWIRIARGRVVKDEVIGQGVDLAVQGLAETISFMTELTLDIEELLLQTDAAKAIVELAFELVDAATDENFKAGVSALTGIDIDDLGVMTDINQASNDIEQYLDYIPEPEDVRGLAHELYRLLAVVQKPFPRDPATNDIAVGDEDLAGTDHLMMDDTGKIRLMAWAYDHGVKVRGLGPDDDEEESLTVFGARRLFSTTGNGDLPQRSIMTWRDGDDKVEIFNFDFDASHAGVDGNEDIAELVKLLVHHGYNDPPMNPTAATVNGDIAANLMKFQAINDLPITGEVDNDIINRLMNLDFDRKSLRRAKRYDANFPWPWVAPTDSPTDPPGPVPVCGDLVIINPSGDDSAREGLEVVEVPPPEVALDEGESPLPYYVVPVAPAGKSPADTNNWPEKQGWISDVSAPVRGFVALHSRPRNLVDGVPDRFKGGPYSEGEAAHGKYFYAARHVEPWREARVGEPGNGALFDVSTKRHGEISRMYQWVPMPTWLNVANPPAAGTWKLYLYASVLQRSLFKEGGGKPDEGRLRLELHGSDVFSTTMSTPAAAAAVAKSTTDWFPSPAITRAALSGSEADRKRSWFLRKTDRVEVTAAVMAAVVIAEGKWVGGWDIDAYFDDFRLIFEWEKVGS